MMKKFFVYIGIAVLAVVMAGCKKQQPAQEQQKELTDTVKHVSEEPIVPEESPKADNFKQIKQEVGWLSTEKEKELEQYLCSYNTVDLEWPIALAGCSDLTPLHSHLVKLLFDRNASTTIEKAVSDFLGLPAYAEEFSSISSKKVSSNQLNQLNKSGSDRCMSYERECRLRMVQTSPTLTTFEVFEYSYSGGAHGGGASEFAIFDRKSGRVYTAENVFIQPQGKTLMKLLNRRIQEMNNKRGTSYMAAEEVPTFYPTSKGLTFVFPPYAIGCYADGSIEVSLTYQALKSELTPDFSEQVKLANTFKQVK